MEGSLAGGGKPKLRTLTPTPLSQQEKDFLPSPFGRRAGDEGLYSEHFPHPHLLMEKAIENFMWLDLRRELNCCAVRAKNKKAPRLRVREVPVVLGESQQLFSSFLRGASCLKSPRSINVKDYVYSV